MQYIILDYRDNTFFVSISPCQIQEKLDELKSTFINPFERNQIVVYAIKKPCTGFFK